MTQLTHLFQPIKIGNVEIRNRLAMAPFGGGGGYAKNEMVTERAKLFYVERARGGAGLILMGLLSPVDAGMDRLRHLYDPRVAARMGTGLAIYKDEFVPGLREMTDALHAEGAKVGVQLSWYARWAKKDGTGMEEVGPSGVLFDRGAGARPPRPMTVEEIEQVVADFAEGARRAKEAGFDIVELHASTGAIIGQFLSKLTNRRTDAYGGDLENRMKFLLDIIAACRQRVGDDYAIIVRMGIADFMEGGNTPEDNQRIAPILERAGVQALHVTTGWHEAPVPFIQMAVPRGHWVDMAAEIKKVVSIPVMGGTRVNDPRLADEIIAQGRLDMVYMGRPLVADPELPNKAREGRFEDIRPCIACSHCFDPRSEDRVGEGVDCSVNPALGRELGYTIDPVGTPKRVFVIGGGPGGMEAALVAAQRGHQVTLLENEAALGGQLLVAALPPHKEEISNLTRYLTRQVEKAGVDIRLNAEVTAAAILEANPDAVIVATGGVPLVPDIPGVAGDNVATAIDVLTGRKEVGERVLIVGGGLVGCETADFLLERGKKVTILEMLPRIGNDIGASSRWVTLMRLRGAGVRMEANAKVVAIAPDGVTVERRGATEFFEGDSVVLATGLVANDALAKELEGKVPSLHVIGDAAGPRRIYHATKEGFLVGREVLKEPEAAAIERAAL